MIKTGSWIFRCGGAEMNHQQDRMLADERRARIIDDSREDIL
jgi:hypothetical protein